MTHIQIKHGFNGNIIFETDAEDLAGAVMSAVAAKVNLAGANLAGASLYGANLNEASLYGANLNGANLNGASLYGANLNEASLYGANLNGANLNGASLYGANLNGASLNGASLYGASLNEASLNEASLYGANLNEASLYGASLNEASLYGANLAGANLNGANLNEASLYGANLNDNQLKSLLQVRTILPDGDLIGWKKLQDGTICKLKIPASAKRVGGMMGRKCRAEFAVVLEGSGCSKRDPLFRYEPGKEVRPDKYDQNPLEECSHGIHFFITRQEAEEYD